jgi:hypothetical protein
MGRWMDVGCNNAMRTVSRCRLRDLQAQHGAISSSAWSTDYSVKRVTGNPFFYKYDPLSNGNAKNNPLQLLLLKIARRNEEKVPRSISRHCTWRVNFPPRGDGGRGFPPLTKAGCDNILCQPYRVCHMPMHASIHHGMQRPTYVDRFNHAIA